MIHNFRRNMAKRRLVRKIEEWKAFCIKNEIRHSNENIAVCRFMLAEIVMLRQQFLPWGKYFIVRPYGFSYLGTEVAGINQELKEMYCGTMDCILAYDLRMHHRLKFHESGKPMWIPHTKANRF